MKGLWALTKVQAKLFFREPVALFFTLAFPLLMLLMFGMMFGNDPNPAWHGFGYIDSEVPGLTAIILGTVGLIGIPVATATAREAKVLRRFRASPMPAWQLIVADIVVNVAVAAVGVVLLVLVGMAVFGLRFGGNPLEVGAGFLLSALAFCSLGYLLAGVAPTARVAQVVGQVMFFPMMFLSGATFPSMMMPEAIQKAALFLPLTHVVRLLQGLWFGRGWDLTAVGVLTAVAVLGAALAARLFRWE